MSCISEQQPISNTFLCCGGHRVVDHSKTVLKVGISSLKYQPCYKAWHQELHFYSKLLIKTSLYIITMSCIGWLKVQNCSHLQFTFLSRHCKFSMFKCSEFVRCSSGFVTMIICSYAWTQETLPFTPIHYAFSCAEVRWFDCSYFRVSHLAKVCL